MNMLTVLKMKAVKNFKRLIDPTKAESPVMQSILGHEHESHFVQPPMEMEPEESFTAGAADDLSKSHSLDMYNRSHPRRDLVLNGYHQEQGLSFPAEAEPETAPTSGSGSAAAKPAEAGTRGHARDPLEEDFPYLFIGPSTFTGSNEEDPVYVHNREANNNDESNNDNDNDDDDDDDQKNHIIDSQGDYLVSESPAAAEFDIYETAYRQQIENIRKRSLTRRGTFSKVYLTRRVEDKDHVKKLVEGMPQQEQEEDDVDADGSSESFPKRKVTPITHTVGLMKAQLERHRQRAQQGQLSATATGTGSDAPG